MVSSTMPIKRKRRGSKPTSPALAEREPRGARRKRQTRARLLEAALGLMAEKGMEGATINEITEAADVGFGSFYNHFESREALYAELVDSVFEDFADALDQLVVGISDPAEVISVCVRHTLLRAQREPVWGRFLLREGVSPRALDQGLGPRLLRDLQRGIAAKRFSVADPLISLLSVGGMVLGSIAMQLRFSSPEAVALLKRHGFVRDNFPERVAAALLRVLGLGRAESQRIARRPLPAGDPLVPGAKLRQADKPARPRPAPG